MFVKTILKLACLVSAGVLCASEEVLLRRVHAHLLIEDARSALQEAEHFVSEYPDSRLAGAALIEALSSGNREEEALQAWNVLSLKYPDLISDRNLLEEVAWSVLRRGIDSTQNGVKLAAMIGAYLTQDARAVAILKRMMRDSNAVLRSIALQMAPSYRDAPLKDEVARLMVEEKVWVVRLEAIKAAGALQIRPLADSLKAIVQSDRSTYEERQYAIEALLNIYENISPEEFKKLATSNRAGIRHLACSAAAHFEIAGAAGEVMRMTRDPHPDVRIAALNAFGLYYRHCIEEAEAREALAFSLKDSHPSVAITAAWAALFIDPSLSRPAFEKWLNDPAAENRRLAAAALSAGGSRGIDLSVKMLEENRDPYVRVNLALGLLGQRVFTDLGCDCIYDFLQNEKKLWMWDTRYNPLFQVLAPSQVRHVDHIPNYPEAVDQMTRLNLVSLLAILEDARAKEALKSFLQKKSWGITGVAAATLLQEGDESSLDVVRGCLQEEDPNIRLQACLVLAMMGQDPSVLSVLQGAYGEADHERKLHILEALGKIGTEASFSFLLGVLREPFPILRVAAAAALIQCINR